MLEKGIFKVRNNKYNLYIKVPSKLYIYIIYKKCVINIFIIFRILKFFIFS